MIKNSCCILSLLMGAPFVQAQELTKSWVFFTDKLDAAGKATVVEAGYVSERARDRRIRRGSGVPALTDAPVSPAYLAELRGMGIEPVFESRWLNAVSTWLDTEKRAAASALPFVQRIRNVAKLTVAEAPGVPLVYALAAPKPRRYRLDYGPSQGQLELVNAIPALERGINGDGVVLGFLDTRFDISAGNPFDHRALRHIADSGRITARDFTAGDQQFAGSNQSDRHGISVASVAAGFEEGQLIGPAYGATVFAATTEFAPHERHSEEDNFVAALEWMEAEGVDVANSSLGYTNDFDAGEGDYTIDDLDGNTGITTIAVDVAAAMGVIFVTSAGNSGTSPWMYITTPADADSVISVGAVHPDRTKASFSGFGPTADGRIKPEVAAQGTRVHHASGNGGYASGRGASFSSPMVAGIVCQMVQVNPDIRPIEAREILKATSSQWDRPDNLLGWGIVDADAAIREAERCANPGVVCVTPTTLNAEETATLPEVLELVAPYPNPFSESAVFTVNAARHVSRATLSIYDVLGRRVAVPFSGPLHGGVQEIVFEAQALPRGLYVYALEADGATQSGKILLMQ